MFKIYTLPTFQGVFVGGTLKGALPSNITSNITLISHSFMPWHQRLTAVLALVAQTVKCLPAMRETQVRSLGWEDPLEKEMATHSSTLA